MHAQTQVLTKFAFIVLVVSSSGSPRVSGQSAGLKFAIYELEPSTGITDVQINELVTSQGFDRAPADQQHNRESAHGRVAFFKDKSSKTRLIFDSHTGSVDFLPSLGEETGPAPSSEESRTISTKWLKSKGLLGKIDDGLTVGEVSVSTKQTFTPDGKNGKPVDVLRTVHFFRELDGLRLYGPSSTLTTDVGATGVVGLFRSLRPVVLRSRAPTEIKTLEQARLEFSQLFGPEIMGFDGSAFHCDTSVSLIYYEQGLRYVQPAYKFEVQIVGPTGVVGGYVRLIAAAQTSPEMIINRAHSADNIKPDTPSPVNLPKPAVGSTPSIRYGMYVVRDDSSDWLDDALAFHESFEKGNSYARTLPGPKVPPAEAPQYYWNTPWLWEVGGGEPDLSEYFVGTRNYVIIEGHGLPWWVSTKRNCCDVINLDKTAGYGDLNGRHGRTNYIVWKSCSVIPAPGDAPGGNYQPTASPVDVWWTVFKGLRGTYGYRTGMWTDDYVSEQFALSVGLGSSNLSSWFHATENNRFAHSNEWEYGSGVIVTNHEGDGAYETGSSKADSLTIWWQHRSL